MRFSQVKMAFYQANMKFSQGKMKFGEVEKKIRIFANKKVDSKETMRFSSEKFKIPPIKCNISSKNSKIT